MIIDLRVVAVLLVSGVISAAAPAKLDWKAGGGFRRAALAPIPSSPAGFTLLSNDTTGLRFTNHLSDASVAENQIRLLGSGVALGDVDGDGLCDIYLCRLEGPNALYRNLGDWRFEEITAAAGVACPGQYSTGAILADLDGDSDLDLLVNGIGTGTRCFINDGKARFAERNSGLLQKLCATSTALADVDGNGTLDLYVANYRTTTIRSTGLQVLNINGRRVLRPQDRDGYELTPEGLILEHAEPDAFYLNDGAGNFTPVPWTNGRFSASNGSRLPRGDKDWGLSVMLRDMNGDGAPDIYVCNDFWSADAVWINDGRGYFHPLPPLAMRNSSTFSMGVDFADINRDGSDDFFVLDMRSREHARRMTQRAMLGGVPALTEIEERPQTERNTLFLSRGDGTYAEIAQLAGLEASEWSWATAFVDVDLDGYEDLLITTGHGFDSQDADADERTAKMRVNRPGERIIHFPRLYVPNQAFRNRGDLTFEPRGDVWNFNAVGVSHGMALADLDSDGDLDVVVNNLNGAAGIYRNNASASRLVVRLQGNAPNTRGIGARIEVGGGPVVQSQQMICGGRYLSCDEAQRVFATGSATGGLTLTIRWRNGNVSVVSNAAPNHLYAIDEKLARPIHKAAEPAAPTLFRDVSQLLAHRHRDEAFNDFERQPLLAKRLSQAGPGIAWTDVDLDGRDDLVIGSGRGGGVAVFQNAGAGPFRAAGVLRSGLDDDTAGIVSLGAAGATSLLVGQGRYESAAPGTPLVSEFAFAGPAPRQTSIISAELASAGPLALADVDGDGTLELFVGGRVAPGRYPEPATSGIFRRVDQRWIAAQQFDQLGLVNGAVFTDLDADGFPELVLACEWGPVKILRRERGVFREVDWGIANLRGWWTGVTAGDFDGDGRMDLVAGNWGRNSAYESHLAEGVRIYYGDYAGSGRIDGVEAFVEGGRVWPRRDLDTMARALPWLRGKFTSYAAFSKATIEELLGDRLPAAKVLQVNRLDSTVFLNRGGRFEVRPLPIEAQFTPAFGICASDFDGDGHEDVFLAQNFFPTDGDTSRYDAGRGLLLRGDGRGDFTAVPGQRSGLLIYGEQRGAAACDYDGDGRVDLAVGQNRADTKLFHNERAFPAVRIRLRGPDGNKLGIGASLRRGTGQATGRASEIHAGSGYWSQDSSTMVLSGAGEDVFVRWPGGRQTRSRLPAGAGHVAIDADGKVEVLP